MTEIVIKQKDAYKITIKKILDDDGNYFLMQDEIQEIVIEEKSLPALISALNKMQGGKNWHDEFNWVMDNITDIQFLNWVSDNVNKRFEKLRNELNENPKTK